MATTKSNIPRLLSAAVSHHNATTLPRPHYNLLRHNHSFPTSFLHSHPSNPHLLTTPVSRRVHSLATALHKRPLNPRNIWPYAVTLGCIGGLTGIIFYKLREKPVVVVSGSASTELELRLQGLVPNMYRKGHSVVVEVLFRPIKNNDNCNPIVKFVGTKKLPRDWEMYLSATEVLADQPHQLNAALQRNNVILVHKQLDSGYTTPSDVISGSGVDLSKSESEPRVNQFCLSQLSRSTKFLFVSFMSDVIKDALNTFEDSLPNLLQDGRSVFIRAFFKDELYKIKEDKWDQIRKVQLDEMKKDESDKIKEYEWAESVSRKIRGFECHYFAVVVAKHDERYMPREATAAIGRNVAE